MVINLLSICLSMSYRCTLGSKERINVRRSIGVRWQRDHQVLHALQQHQLTCQSRILCQVVRIAQHVILIGIGLSETIIGLIAHNHVTIGAGSVLTACGVGSEGQVVSHGHFENGLTDCTVDNVSTTLPVHKGHLDRLIGGSGFFGGSGVEGGTVDGTHIDGGDGTVLVWLWLW